MAQMLHYIRITHLILRRHIMKRLLYVFAFLTIFGSATAANAAVLTFEDLYPGYEGYAGFSSTSYGGFTWGASTTNSGEPSTAWITKYAIPGSGYEYGTIGTTSILSWWASDISMSSSTNFDFNGAYITSAWQGTETVDVEGWDDGTLVYSTTITTHNNAAYWFTFNYTDIDTVWFNQNGGDGGHIDIDNITYSESTSSTVPEPATLMLIGAGFAGIALTRRLKNGKNG